MFEFGTTYVVYSDYTDHLLCMTGRPECSPNAQHLVRIVIAMGGDHISIALRTHKICLVEIKLLRMQWLNIGAQRNNTQIDVVKSSFEEEESK